MFNRKYIFNQRVHFPASYVSWRECTHWFYKDPLRSPTYLVSVPAIYFDLKAPAWMVEFYGKLVGKYTSLHWAYGSGNSSICSVSALALGLPHTYGSVENGGIFVGTSSFYRNHDHGRKGLKPTKNQKPTLPFIQTHPDRVLITNTLAAPC